MLGDYIGKLFQVVQSKTVSADDKVKATLCLGEIGIFKDLSQIKDVIVTISSLFEDANDQVRQAAAISLGSVSIGNTGFFLDQVFKLIESS